MADNEDALFTDDFVNWGEFQHRLNTPLTREDFPQVATDVSDSPVAMRFDAGKAPMHLLPPDALLGLAKVYAFGAKKYAPRNWEKGMDWSRVYDSLIRHTLAFWAGEDLDPESGLPHVDHMVWNAVTLSAYQKRGVGGDDRPQKADV